MGQAQSGQNAFPGQGQQGEKKDQAGCPADAGLSTSALALCAMSERDLRSRVVFQASYQLIGCQNTCNKAHYAPLKLLAFLLYLTEGEEEMGAAATSTTSGEEATPVCKGEAPRACLLPACTAALSLHHYHLTTGHPVHCDQRLIMKPRPETSAM